MICDADPATKLAAIQVRFTVCAVREDHASVGRTAAVHRAIVGGHTRAMKTRAQHGVALISILLVVALVTRIDVPLDDAARRSSWRKRVR